MRSGQAAKCLSRPRATTCSSPPFPPPPSLPLASSRASAIITASTFRYDLARLTAFDCGVLDETKLKDEDELTRLSRDNVQLLIDTLYALPMEVRSNAEIILTIHLQLLLIHHSLVILVISHPSTRPPPRAI